MDSIRPKEKPTSQPPCGGISENIRVLLDPKTNPDIHNIYKINDPLSLNSRGAVYSVT